MASGRRSADGSRAVPRRDARSVRRRGARLRAGVPPCALMPRGELVDCGTGPRSHASIGEHRRQKRGTASIVEVASSHGASRARRGTKPAPVDRVELERGARRGRRDPTSGTQCRSAIAMSQTRSTGAAKSTVDERARVSTPTTLLGHRSCRRTRATGRGDPSTGPDRRGTQPGPDRVRWRTEVGDGRVIAPLQPATLTSRSSLPTTPETAGPRRHRGRTRAARVSPSSPHSTRRDAAHRLRMPHAARGDRGQVCGRRRAYQRSPTGQPTTDPSIADPAVPVPASRTGSTSSPGRVRRGLHASTASSGEAERILRSRARSAPDDERRAVLRDLRRAGRSVAPPWTRARRAHASTSTGS